MNTSASNLSESAHRYQTYDAADSCPQVLEFSLPEDIERLRNERRAGAVTYDALELLEEAPAPATASSLEVAWRPPTKGAERIASYKVGLPGLERGTCGVGLLGSKCEYSRASMPYSIS